jgi:hypothetical protein
MSVSFIPVAKTGASLTSTASAIVSCPVPLTSDGKVAQYVKFRSTAPGFVKISETAGEVANTDTMVQVADELTMSTNGMSFVSFTALTTATLQITPIEWGSYFPRSVLSVLAKFGANAHVYLPGVSPITGDMLTSAVTPGNYLDSAGTTAATVDNPVGLALDAVQAMTLGAELAPSVSSTSGFTTSGDSIAVSGSSIVLTATAKAYPNIGAAITTVVGQTYVVNITYHAGTWGGSVASTWNGGIFTATPTAGVISYIFVATATSTPVQLFMNNASATGTIYLDSISVRQVPGTHATQSTTANKPILRYANGRYSHEYNGSTNYLALGAPLFQMSDDHCVVAGFNGTNVGGNGTLFEVGNSTAVNARVCSMRINTGSVNTIWNDGTTSLQSTSGTCVAGTPFVMSARKVGNNVRTRNNGVDGNLLNTVLTSTTSTAAFIGNRDTGATSEYANGKMYPIIAIKGTVSDADLLTLERWVGSLSGVSF